MALGGIAPVIIFTFFKEIKTPAFLGISSVKIPFVPIPIYLDEQLTKINLDDYNRTITIDVMREADKSFEKASTDSVMLKFTANKDNIVLTALSALFMQIVSVLQKPYQTAGSPDYKLTVFYDNIFLLDASLESFTTNLRSDTDLREITVQLSTRPKPEAKKSEATANTGSATGLL
jgi:hypothetical protein